MEVNIDAFGGVKIGSDSGFEMVAVRRVEGSGDSGRTNGWTDGIPPLVATTKVSRIDQDVHRLPALHPPPFLRYAVDVSVNEHPFVALARDAIRYYLATGEFLDSPTEPGDPPSSGVFVSLHDGAPPGQIEGRLRGCIGSVRPRNDSLRNEIVRLAVAAATSDPRFAPLQPGEVDDLDVTVYLLADPEPIDSLDDLDPSRYGVIVDGPGGRTGLLLPAIPGISEAVEQVDIARRKASISPSDPIRLSRFEATIIK